MLQTSCRPQSSPDSLFFCGYLSRQILTNWWYSYDHGFRKENYQQRQMSYQLSVMRRLHWANVLGPCGFREERNFQSFFGFSLMFIWLTITYPENKSYKRDNYEKTITTSQSKLEDAEFMLVVQSFLKIKFGWNRSERARKWFQSSSWDDSFIVQSMYYLGSQLMLILYAACDLGMKYHYW